MFNDPHHFDNMPLNECSFQDALRMFYTTWNSSEFLRYFYLFIYLISRNSDISDFWKFQTPLFSNISHSFVMFFLVFFLFSWLSPKHPSNISDNTWHHKKTNSNPHSFAYPYYSYPYLILSLIVQKQEGRSIPGTRLSTTWKIQWLNPHTQLEPTNPPELGSTWWCHHCSRNPLSLSPVITHNFWPLSILLFTSYHSYSTSSLSFLSRRTQMTWFNRCLVTVQTVTIYLEDLDIQDPTLILSQLNSHFPSHGQCGHPHPPLVLLVHLLENPPSPKTPWQSIHKDSLVLESVHMVLTQPGTPVSFWGMCIYLLFTLGTRAQIPTGYMVKTLKSQSTCDSNMPSDQMLSTF